jgi:hypothetical protein
MQRSPAQQNAGLMIPAAVRINGASFMHQSMVLGPAVRLLHIAEQARLQPGQDCLGHTFPTPNESFSLISPRVILFSLLV